MHPRAAGLLAEMRGGGGTQHSVFEHGVWMQQHDSLARLSMAFGCQLDDLMRWEV